VLRREEGSELSPVMNCDFTTQIDRVFTVIVSDFVSDDFGSFPVRMAETLSAPLIGSGSSVPSGDELPEVSTS